LEKLVDQKPPKANEDSPTNKDENQPIVSSLNKESETIVIREELVADMGNDKAQL